jgi:hypothetical protein
MPERSGRARAPATRVCLADAGRVQQARTARPTENNRSRVSRPQGTGWKLFGGDASEWDQLAKHIAGSAMSIGYHSDDKSQYFPGMELHE